MNMKYVIGAIVCGAIGAGVAYYICTKDDKAVSGDNDNKKSSDYVENKNQSCYNQDTSGDLEDVIVNAAENYQNNRTDAVDSIKIRHEKAAEQMRESLNNIINTDSGLVTENTEILNKMLDDIDNLLD